MRNFAYALICIAFLSALCAGRAMGAEDNWYVNHPAKKLETYNFNPAAPLVDRVIAPPDFMLDFLNKYDEGFAPEGTVYTAYSLTDSERAEVKQIMDALPSGYAKALKKYMLGVYFVQNLTGSGFADSVTDKQGNLFFFIAFNPKVLHEDASQWLTNKEKSVFIMDDPSYDLTIDIGGGLSGFYYIFFHEAAHGYDYVKHVTPGEPNSWTSLQFESMKKAGRFTGASFKFSRDLWDTFAEPKPAADFPERKNITFYGWRGGPKIPISQAPAVYAQLLNSPFITLYGSVNRMEDFAEYAAAIFSIKQLKRPWTLRITKNGETVFEMTNILERKNISGRIKFVDNLLK